MRYQHDCENCTPLGEYGEFDLYHCEQGGAYPTVIARYGDDGPEYQSGLVFAHSGQIPELVEAMNRAAELGLAV
jgi:hypothetical protein